VEYAGGYSDYRAQRGATDAPMQGARSSAPKPTKAAAPKPAAPSSKKMSFKQTRRLDLLPAEMEALGAEIGKLEALLADTGLYARDPARFDKASQALTERQGKLAAAEEEWLELEEMRESLA